MTMPTTPQPADPTARVLVDAWPPFVEGRGDTEKAAFLDAARRLRARIGVLTDEELAARLEGHVGNNSGDVSTTYRDAKEWEGVEALMSEKPAP